MLSELGRWEWMSSPTSPRLEDFLLSFFFSFPVLTLFLFSIYTSHLLVHSDLTQVQGFFCFLLFLFSLLLCSTIWPHSLLRHSCQKKITFTFSSIILDRRLSLRPKWPVVTRGCPRWTFHTHTLSVYWKKYIISITIGSIHITISIIIIIIFITLRAEPLSQPRPLSRPSPAVSCPTPLTGGNRWVFFPAFVLLQLINKFDL